MVAADAQRFAELTGRKRDAEAQLRDIRRQVAEVEGALIEGMVASDMQNLTIGGFTLYLYNEMSVRARDRDHLRLARALLDSGREDLIVVGSQRLRAEVRSDEDLEALPPEIREAISVEHITKVGARKAG